MSWMPINCKTHYSLQKAFCKSAELAEKCAEYGYKACAIADIKTLAGAVNFHQNCVKNGVKPIIGCDFGDYILYAKNKDGWFELIKYVSHQTLDVLKELAGSGNVICLTSISNGAGFKNLFGVANHFQYDYKEDGVYYINEKDAECHRIVLCGGLKTTLKKAKDLIKSGKGIEGQEFFESDSFYLPKQGESLPNPVITKIVELCEDYEVSGLPMLPAFPCPDNMDEDEYILQLCRQGWHDKLIGAGKVKKQNVKDIYTTRIKRELDVIVREARLSGYFLIVQDIVNWIRSKGWLAGPGRGSAAGCLISYLLDITAVDPVEYDLIFERFYNAGRNTDGHISLPDIDVDVPAEKRDEVIAYIKEKYGAENVAQMITFGRLQGRSAIKEVLRINSAVSFDEMNAITSSIPDEARISDQLELMDDKSIIKWTLQNTPEKLNNWCTMNENGQLEGSLSHLFEQAIRIEGTNKSQGKHPAGVIISKFRLSEVCPMTKDKSGDPIAAFDMGDMEAQGHVKFDILGVDVLSKVMEVSAYSAQN